MSLQREVGVWCHLMDLLPPQVTKGAGSHGFALHLLSPLSAAGYGTRAAGISKRVGTVMLQQQSKQRCSVPKNLLPGRGYITQVCVCTYICIWKNINSIPTSTFGWWQMVLIVTVIMHNFILSAFFTHYCSEIDIKLFLSAFLHTNSWGEPFILVIIEKKILVN